MLLSGNVFAKSRFADRSDSSHEASVDETYANKPLAHKSPVPGQVLVQEKALCPFTPKADELPWLIPPALLTSSWKTRCGKMKMKHSVRGHPSAI